MAEESFGGLGELVLTVKIRCSGEEGDTSAAFATGDFLGERGILGKRGRGTGGEFDLGDKGESGLAIALLFGDTGRFGSSLIPPKGCLDGLKLGEAARFGEALHPFDKLPAVRRFSSSCMGLLTREELLCKLLLRLEVCE